MSGRCRKYTDIWGTDNYQASEMIYIVVETV